MVSENGKREKTVSKGHGRLSRVLALTTLALLLAVIPSASVIATANSDVAVTTDTDMSEGTTFYIPTRSVLHGDFEVSGAVADERGLPIKVTPIEGLESALQPDWAKDALRDRASNPSPASEPGPEPTDAPFLTNDVLVFNNPSSQRNTSLAHFDNGDLLVAYDHVGPGGDRDVYASKSVDGGNTWNQYTIEADPGEEEACASIAGDYSPAYGTEIFYAWYSNPTMQFSYSFDGVSWTPFDFGFTFWSEVSCPYVVVDGDFVFVIAQRTVNSIDTWYTVYTIDAFQSTLLGYYWTLPTDWTAYRPRVAITGTNEVMTAVNIFFQDDPNPANWYNDTLLIYSGELTCDQTHDLDPTITWLYGTFFAGPASQLYADPTIVSDGAGAVVVAMTFLDPIAIPLTTSSLLCMWTDQVTSSGATWNGCNHGLWFLAFDPLDANDQKYPHFHWDPGGAIHAVWANGTDINYKFSSDGGDSWSGDLATGDPMKVNEVGVGTHLDQWHSPDIDFVNGRPTVAWHDTRGGDDIYFQTTGSNVFYTLDTQPRVWDLWVRADGGAWQPPSHTYQWAIGTQHDIECVASFEVPGDTRYTFNRWDDGVTQNPRTITVDGVDNDKVCIYDVDYWLDMINGGATNPPSGYQAAGSLVTIEAFAPAAPPGGQYAWLGWTGIGPGSYTGPDNPCVDCVEMLGPVTEIANWQLQWEVTFDTIPTNLMIEINGQQHQAPYQEFLNDSEMYNINAPSPQMGGPGLQYTFSSWNDSGPQSHNVFVTQAGVSFIATFIPEYWLTVTTNVPGLDVRVNGMDYPAPYSFWCPDGPGPWLDGFDPQYLGVLGERYMFVSWSTGGSKLHRHNCTSTETVTANYVLQRSVNITTNPVGFNVIVDGITYGTPAQFWWNDSSMHTVEALATIQAGPNNQYAFIDWSDFGARVHDVWANTSDMVLTADYVFQHKITFQANEPDVSIELDGTPTALPYVYWCDDGTTHTLNAPSPQTFVDTRYLWTSWSDSGGQSHNYVCIAPAIVQANFDREYRVYINTTLDGAPHTLDIIAGGNTYTTPAQVWWAAGQPMSLDTTEFQPGQDPVSGMRYRWVDWDDSTMKTHNVNINSPGMEFVANFKTQYRLTFSDAHGVPGTVPAGELVTGGAYFDMGATVEISTDDVVSDTADHRWRFDGWTGTGSGSYTGSDNPVTITMDEAITQTAGWVDQYLLTIVSPYGTPDASGYYEKVTGETKYWYDAGDSATFWVETEVSTATGAKAVFDSWTGGANGTAMNAALTVTAGWHMEYLVTVNSEHGTEPTPEWIVAGGSYALTIEEMEEDLLGTTRWQFNGWTGSGTGSYTGDTRQVQLTVGGPITENAAWQTQYYLSITSIHIAEPLETLGNPTGEGWYDDGAVATITVDKSDSIGDYNYKFKQWIGDVADTKSATTTTTMNMPKSLVVEWSRTAKFSIMDYWWIFVIIVLVIVALIAVLLLRKKKPAEEEVLPPEEEYPAEEPPAPPAE